MARKRTPDKEYRARLKAIQKFVDFSVNPKTPLTASQKRQISIYYNAIKTERLQSAVTYKGTKKNVQLVAKTIGSNIPKARLKAIPIPTTLKGAKVRIRTRKIKRKGKRAIKEKTVVVKTKLATEVFIYLSQKKMLDDPKGELTKKIGKKKFKYGKFNVFNNWCNQGFGDLESAIDVWLYYYVNSYISALSDKNNCLRGCMLFSVKTEEEYKKTRSITGTTKKRKKRKKRRAKKK